MLRILRVLFNGLASRWMAVVALTAGFAAMALKFLPVPFAWIGIGSAIVGFCCAPFVARVLSMPLLIAASASLAAGLAELVLPPIVRPTATEQPTLEQKNPLLGWSLKPSQASRSSARVGDQVIYDVTYTIDPSGQRVSPPDRGASADGCALFFACSFVFGVGVQDSQTLPYQTGVKTEGRFRVINLAVGGYGAEHMLAAMERGSLAERRPCEPTHVIYVALPHHVLRAAGKTFFSLQGPRYRLGSDGNLEYLGTHPDVGLAGWRGWRFGVGHQVAKSRFLFRLIDREPPATEEDLQLYFAIVDRAFRLFKHHWPKAALHIISWDIHPFFANGKERFHTGLRGVPARLHVIDDILPGYSADNIKYGLHRADLHPNALAYEMAAAYVAERILGANPIAQPSSRATR